MGIKDEKEIIFVEKKDSNNFKIKWNIIQIKEFLIQNAFSKNFLEVKSGRENYFFYFNPICSNNIESNNYNNVSDSFKFSFLKLFEEVNKAWIY